MSPRSRAAAQPPQHGNTFEAMCLKLNPVPPKHGLKLRRLRKNPHFLSFPELHVQTGPQARDFLVPIVATKRAASQML